MLRAGRLHSLDCERPGFPEAQLLHDDFRDPPRKNSKRVCLGALLIS